MSENLKKRAALLGIWLLCQLAAWVAGWRMLWSVFSNPAKAWNLAVAYDLLGNVAANGWLGETISSRAGKAQREGRRWACVLCRLLDVFDKNHCENEIQPGVGDPVPPLKH
jgi:hypothetical protein